ncbi:MAG: hypothetical protein Q4D91_13235 [Lautropia sp.]|nr:hypothetical protein [Lautropia sp.]
MRADSPDPFINTHPEAAGLGVRESQTGHPSCPVWTAFGRVTPDEPVSEGVAKPMREVDLIRGVGAGAVRPMFAAARPVCSASRPSALRRRSLLLGLLVLGLGLSSNALVFARRQAGPGARRPLSRAQQALVIQAMTALAQLEIAYIHAGIDQAEAGLMARLMQARKQVDQLMSRIRHELGRHVEPRDLKRIRAQWETVADATRTRPSKDIAHLMMPMAAEINATLAALLPEVPEQIITSREGRSRRVLLLQQLLLSGVAICWDPSLAPADEMLRQRETLARWLEARAGQGIDGVRLRAQWNLFTSALPLPNGDCLPDAAHTMMAVCERLEKLV